MSTANDELLALGARFDAAHSEETRLSERLADGK
jgi:hypothetical protein